MRKWIGCLTVVCLSLWLTGSATARMVPPHIGSTFFSPQLSPDGSLYLWESLEKEGSIWISDVDGGNLTFLTVGHSPTWLNDQLFKFLRTEDDGHQVVVSELYLYDLEDGVAYLLAEDADNPDYSTVVEAHIGGDVTPAKPLTGTVVVLDPGHGKDTGSYATETETYEDFYALESAYIVKDYLETSGATVRLSRIDNSTNPGLPLRVNYSNACSADVFISVHYNAVSYPSAHGTETLYRYGNDAGQALAKVVVDEMVALGGLTKRGARPDKKYLGYYLGVLSSNHNTNERCLTEGAFISNPEEALLVERVDFAEKLSWGIYSGLCAQLGVEPFALTTPTLQPIDDPCAGGPTKAPWFGSPVAIVALETPDGDGSAAVVRTERAPFSVARRGGTCWDDYRLYATAQRLEGDGVYGLVARNNHCARHRGHLVGYLLLVDEEARRASLLLSAGRPNHAVELAHLSLEPSRQGWRELVLQCVGDTVVASVDGTALEAAAGMGADGGTLERTIAQGKVGVFVCNGDNPTAVAVDHFSLEHP